MIKHKYPILGNIPLFKTITAPPNSQSYSRSVMCCSILSSLHTTYQDGGLMYSYILCSYCDLLIHVSSLCL